MNKKSRILITGGCGFIPSHMIDRLVEEGFKNILSIDNMMGADNKFSKNDSCEYKYGDISNYKFLETIFQDENFDYVFHLGANANVPFSNKFPEIDFDSNALGTFNILNLCIKHNIKKVLFASTAAVYGEPLYTPMDEKHELLPRSNYGVTKLYGEKLGLAYEKTYDLDFTAIRIFNTYGPRQSRYVLYDLIKKLNANNEKLEVLGTGEQIRDYSYVSDTIEAFFIAFTNPKSRGKVYNVSGGKQTSIKQLVAKISKALEINPKINYTNESWKGDISNMTASINFIKDDLGFEPKVDLDKGLKLSIKWFKENNLI
ncbi:GDP-mannose 4,6-dehydratase [Algibacter sp. R77976]|uniref:GDP-mannose 4,6-dehydratase n=1 Tax=Algibacter sp. R77976 TaxID=3093873 RepID=UPI0037CBA195